MKIDFCPNKRRLILLSCPLQLISIDSRSPSGLRLCFFACALEEWCFNSRSPSGLRLDFHPHAIGEQVVSIHAAQAGCDFVGVVNRKSYCVSIHAAQAGCDLHSSCSSSLIYGCFNSRSPSGLRRGWSISSRRRRLVSIHAAQAGCDIAYIHKTGVGYVSIHAAQAGCDEQVQSLPLHPRVSIHAAQAGCDRLACASWGCFWLFQFTQPKRAATLLL